MSTNKYFSFLGAMTLLFTFIYTLKINFNLDAKLNIFNFALTFVIFIFWLIAIYIFLIKDVLKSPERERNGIVALLIILAIIFFYYNPLYSPENYLISLPRISYFILTIIVTLFAILLAKGKNFFNLTLAIFIPLTTQSFLVNILEITTFVNYTFIAIFILVILVFFVNYKQKS